MSDTKTVGDSDGHDHGDKHDRHHDDHNHSHDRHHDDHNHSHDGHHDDHNHHHDHDHDHDHNHDHDHDDDYSNEFDIYPAEFLNIFESPTFSSYIIDVREPWELEEARIAGSISIPLQSLQKDLSKLDPDKAYYILCTSGLRSSYASSFMLSLGFENVNNIQGGLNGIIESVITRETRPEWLILESLEPSER